MSLHSTNVVVEEICFISKLTVYFCVQVHFHFFLNLEGKKSLEKRPFVCTVPYIVIYIWNFQFISLALSLRWLPNDGMIHRFRAIKRPFAGAKKKAGWRGREDLKCIPRPASTSTSGGEEIIWEGKCSRFLSLFSFPVKKNLSYDCRQLFLGSEINIFFWLLLQHKSSLKRLFSLLYPTRYILFLVRSGFRAHHFDVGAFCFFVLVIRLISIFLLITVMCMM